MLPTIVLTSLLLTLLPLCSSLRILVSNDDGFGTANIRALFEELSHRGHSVLISAPAMQQSGTNGRMRPATPLCVPAEFGLAPKGSPAEGKEAGEAADERIWYVNSTPASSVQWGIEVLSQRMWGADPDLVVTGTNQGSNLGLAYLVSGTYGAARYAVARSIPAIAFSAGDYSIRSYKQLAIEDRSADQAFIYARMASDLISFLEAAASDGSGALLPAGTGLNVNFPSAPALGCTSASPRWIITRLLGSVNRSPDACTCQRLLVQHTATSSFKARCKLPIERAVLSRKNGCTNSISLFAPTTWSPDASAQQQADLIARLSGFTSCLPAE